MPSAMRSALVIMAVLVSLPGLLTMSVAAQDNGTNSTGPNTQWENATAITTGTQINESTEGGQENWYQFESAEGGNITVNTTASNGSRLAVFLYSGSQSLDRAFVSSNNTTSLTATANTSGKYFFYVRNTQNSTVNYSFVVQAPAPATTSAPSSSTTRSSSTSETAITEDSSPNTETPAASNGNSDAGPAKNASSGGDSSVDRGLGNSSNNGSESNSSGSVGSGSSSSGSLGNIVGMAIAAIVLVGGTLVLFLVQRS